MSVTAEVFRKRLDASGVLGEEDLRTAHAVPHEPTEDCVTYAKALVRQKLLTAYQAKLLWRDQGDRLVLGNYLVENEIGRGGMGVVLRASHRRMKRQVAIKVLSHQIVRDADAIARFEREVEAVAQLAHPNVVAAYDADEIDGRHFLVMEYVDGRDLDTLVKEYGPLDGDRVIECIVQAARGLGYAHDRGIIHRDVKPANLLLSAEGVVKILDMGLARFEETAQLGTMVELTQTGTVMGTVDYIAPEQARNTRDADARSDVYSLGITLYRLLTNRPAYPGDSVMMRLLAHSEQPIPRIAEFAPNVQPSLQPVFEAMVAKEPGDRCQSMAEVVDRLEACRTVPSISLATRRRRRARVGADGETPFDSIEDDRDSPGGEPTLLDDSAHDVATDPTHTVSATSDTFNAPTTADPETTDPGSTGIAAPPDPTLNEIASLETTEQWDGAAGVVEWYRDPAILAGVGIGAVLSVVLSLVLWWNNGGSSDPSGPATDTTDPVDDEWFVAFDGEMPRGWSDLGPFEVLREALVARTNGYAVLQSEYDDFELRFEWRVGTAGNGGVLYRHGSERPDAAIKGGEYQLIDDNRHPDRADPLKRTGALYGRAPATDAIPKRVGDWNAARIVCRGPSVEHWLNGVRVLAYRTDDPTLRTRWQLFAGAVPVDRGRILFQALAGEVSYRSIRIRELDPGVDDAEPGDPPPDDPEPSDPEPMPSDPPEPAYYTNLFDGRTLNGFAPIGTGNWFVVDGEIVAGGNANGWLATVDDYEDFEFRAEYKLPVLGNSGIFLRTATTTNEANALEIQLLDDARYPSVPATQHTGAVHSYVAPSKPIEAAPNAWHTIRIRVEGQRVRVWHDEVHVLESNLPTTHLPRRGRIGLQQQWRTEARFRNVGVRRLNE